MATRSDGLAFTGLVAGEGSFIVTRKLLRREHRAERVHPCTVEGCERPRRAKGLCRSHHYAAFGR